MTGRAASGAGHRAGRRAGRRAAVIVLFGLAVLALALGSRTSGPASHDARVQHLTRELRCPVCEGLSVADSPSSTARAIATDIRERVDAGESDRTIRRAYVAQYGPSILLAPPAGGVGSLVWVLPIALAVVSIGAGMWTLRRRSVGTTTLSPSTRALVAEALRGEAGS